MAVHKFVFNKPLQRIRNDRRIVINVGGDGGQVVSGGENDNAKHNNVVQDETGRMHVVRGVEANQQKQGAVERNEPNANFGDKAGEVRQIVAPTTANNCRVNGNFEFEETEI